MRGMQVFKSIKQLLLHLWDHPLWSKVIIGQVLAAVSLIEIIKRWNGTDGSYPAFSSFLKNTYIWFIVLGIVAIVYIVKRITNNKGDK